MYRIVIVACLFALIQGALSAQEQQEAKAKDKEAATLEQIQGLWKFTKGVNQGESLSGEELEGMYVLVKRYMMITYDRDDNERYRATFKINASEKPIQIDMTSMVKGQPPANAVGIIEVKKDRWKICYALPGHPRPSSFESTDEDHTMLFVHERLEKEK